MGVAAFWIALAAVIIAGTWRKRHAESLRHETLRLLIEKKPALEVEELRDLLNPPQPKVPEGHPWATRSEPGEGYRIMRVSATVLMISSVGLGALIFGVATAQDVPFPNATAAASGLGALLLIVGIALFVASRFLPRPVDQDSSRTPK